MSGQRSTPAGGYDPILFDLDGTVIDSVALIRESHRHAVRTVLGRDLPDEVLTANVGRPLREQMAVFSPEHADELLRVYREWNHAHTAELLTAYDGMEAGLRELRAAGRRLGIITSKTHPTVRLALDILPIEQHFEVIVAAEDTDLHKPDPAPVRFALDRLGARAESACYVGDAPFDIQAGLGAGVTAIGVTWGFFSRADLADVAPHAIVDTIPELLELCLTS